MFFKISFSYTLLLVIRKAVDFYILTLQTANLDTLPSFNNLYVDYFVFFVFSVMSFPNNDKFFSSFPILILHILFPCLILLAVLIQC